MLEQASSEQILDKEHPAVQAWLRHRPGSSGPRQVVLLKKTRKSVVYRLDGVGPCGTDVVAKLCDRETGRREWLIYEEILCRLPVRSVRCHGFLEESGEKQGWLFLEHAEGTTGAAETGSVQPIVANWLGILHSSASRLARHECLPDRGPEYFLAVLQCARKRLRNSSSRLEPSGTDQNMLAGLVDCFDALENSWQRIDDRCQGLPWTLVHCDFQFKNIVVRDTSSGIEVLALDWEHAGWGPPAPDLEAVDCNIYWSTVNAVWRSAELGRVKEQACCGTLFQLLTAAGWETERLVFGSVEKAVRRLRIYAPSLRASVMALGLRV